jgi:urease alpha subunit
VSLTEALRAVTIHAAGQIGMADQLGTLESGKFADLTILEKDPYGVDPDALMNIIELRTGEEGRARPAGGEAPRLLLPRSYFRAILPCDARGALPRLPRRLP